MTIDNETRFARQVQEYLNAGASALAPKVEERLQKARWNAMARHQAVRNNPPQASSIFTLVAASPRTTLTLMAAALCIGLASSYYYWTLSSEALENEAIDSALLADDIPPNAYLDQGFRRWQERASSSSAL